MNVDCSGCTTIGVNPSAPTQDHMIFFMQTIYFPTSRRGQCYFFTYTNNPHRQPFHVNEQLEASSFSQCAFKCYHIYFSTCNLDMTISFIHNTLCDNWPAELHSHQESYLIHSSLPRYLCPTMVFSCRCKLLPVMAEVDRILRPEGKLIVCDKVEIINEIENMAKSLHWEVRLTFSKESEGLMCLQKTSWRPKEVEASTVS